MKKIYLFAAIMAVVTAFAVFLFASDLSQHRQSTNDVTVVAAKTAIAENTVITEAMLQTVNLPASSVTSGMLQSLSDAIGKVSPYPIVAGEYLYSAKLYAKGNNSTAGLSYSLPDNTRAVSLRVDDLSGVGYFIQAGDSVDITAVYTDLTKTPNITYTSVILENIKVLEIGNKSGASDKGTAEYPSVTVEVSPQDALRLIYYSQNGKILLTLRPVGDDQIINPAPLS